jgi:phosphate transport system protein
VTTHPAVQAAPEGHSAATFRAGFHKDLDALVDQVRDMGALASVALQCALDAFATEDVALCDMVIEGDDVLDERFAALQREVLRLVALQAPVASDARLLIAALRIGLHLERIGDLAVNVAELTKLAAGPPRDPAVLRDLRVMGQAVLDMVDAAMRAFRERDADACPRLRVADDRVDALNRAVLARVLVIQTPKAARRWGLYMDELARQLERAGDHAVDIGEQVWFMVTGEVRELTTASRVRSLRNER